MYMHITHTHSPCYVAKSSVVLNAHHFILYSVSRLLSCLEVSSPPRPPPHPPLRGIKPGALCVPGVYSTSEYIPALSFGMSPPWDPDLLTQPPTF